MKVLVIDCETGGKTPDSPLFEIGGVLLDLESGQIEELFNYIVKNEHFDHNAWIFNNSDLTPNMILNGVKLESIRDEIQGYFDKYYTTAYNQYFDFNVLKDKGFEIKNKYFDPMEAATNILKLPGYYGKYKWPKVTECLEYFGINEDEPHRAMEDARLEALIIKKLNELKSKK